MWTTSYEVEGAIYETLKKNPWKKTLQLRPTRKFLLKKKEKKNSSRHQFKDIGEESGKFVVQISHNWVQIAQSDCPLLLGYETRNYYEMVTKSKSRP
jgi:hypothetical protein